MHVCITSCHHWTVYLEGKSLNRGVFSDGDHCAAVDMLGKMMTCKDLVSSACHVPFCVLTGAQFHNSNLAIIRVLTEYQAVDFYNASCPSINTGTLCNEVASFKCRKIVHVWPMGHIIGLNIRSHLRCVQFERYEELCQALLRPPPSVKLAEESAVHRPNPFSVVSSTTVIPGRVSIGTQFPSNLPPHWHCGMHRQCH